MLLYGQQARHTPILRKLPGVTLPNVAFQEENRWYDEMLGGARLVRGALTCSVL